MQWPPPERLAGVFDKGKPVKKNKKKLKVKKEVLKTLKSEQLSKVAGGWESFSFCKFTL